MGRLGILAGAGELPHIGMKEALAAGEDPIFFSIIESDFHEGVYGDRNIPIHIIKIGTLIKLCKRHKVDRLLLLGKVKKEIIFKNLKFDLKAIGLLAKMINRHDYSIFKTVLDEFAKEKITIISQKTYLQSLFLPEGRFTKKVLNKKELEDVAFGMKYAEKMAELDIGQTVIVLDQSVLAVEAVEGTDSAICRGGSFAKKRKATVCKSSKPGQDHRFDLPTVGENTLRIMHENNCETLALRTGETIIVHPKEFINLAEKLKINILSIGSGNLTKINSTIQKIR
ncbi:MULTISPECIES: LpxI family protein [Leptospira]|uniref:PF06230 family protein n=1 Tax=Leptospira weilii str. UI 13098 TaxID=1088542 RepID=M6QPV6_9LEPT|nr:MULTISPECIES: UDP-2,3-diacylglucosamine diphosphatase LpxI [Leptospira]EMJ66049.1 PF06230 family protein [Leptospira sp. P2653]EMN90892.1 PF06230 family protein [Leptospira weilii str. UI 13098]MDL5246834.1 UDP-2,3-diacylglucosamine diphosphatase LpxI [Leptospira weilii]